MTYGTMTPPSGTLHILTNIRSSIPASHDKLILRGSRRHWRHRGRGEENKKRSRLQVMKTTR